MTHFVILDNISFPREILSNISDVKIYSIIHIIQSCLQMCNIEYVSSLYYKGTSLFAMEVQRVEYSGEFFKKHLSMLLGDFTEIQADHTSLESYHEAELPETLLLLKLSRKYPPIPGYICEMFNLLGFKKILTHICLKSCVQDGADGKQSFNKMGKYITEINAFS